MASDIKVNDLKDRLDKLVAKLAQKEESADFDANHEEYVDQLKAVIQLFIQHSPERKDELMRMLASLEKTWN